MKEAKRFALSESAHREASLYGVTDGKAIGTYLEHKFKAQLLEHFTMEQGNSAKGIDLPSLNVDVKATSVRQPQSSCPFRSARQKVFGLGYSLLIFVYDKADDDLDKHATLKIEHTLFIEEAATPDYTLTRRLREMVSDGANEEDIVAFLNDRHLPMDEIESLRLAQEILEAPPAQGYLTISNALQWRLQYGHAIREAGQVVGVYSL
jgi:hypothetical protein